MSQIKKRTLAYYREETIETPQKKVLVVFLATKEN
jgi:hypothetical protein